MTEVAYAHAHQAKLALRMLLYVSRRPRNHGVARCTDSQHFWTGFNALQKTDAQYWRRAEPPVHTIRDKFGKSIRPIHRKVLKTNQLLRRGFHTWRDYLSKPYTSRAVIWRSWKEILLCDRLSTICHSFNWKNERDTN